MNKIVLYIFYIFTIIISIYFSIYHYFNDSTRYFGLLPLIPLLLLPLFLKTIKKYKISFEFELFYIIFLLLTQVGGSIINLYDIFHWYDTFLHALSGFLSACCALLILRYSKFNYKKNIIFTIIYMVVFTFLIAGVWEIYEYTYDLITGSDMQTGKYLGINDTMVDNIAAYLGGAFFILLYLIKPIQKFISTIIDSDHIKKEV